MIPFKQYLLEKDWESVSKPPKDKWNTPKWDGVSLGKVKKQENTLYIHRVGSKLYDDPLDIPKKEVEFIKTTG